MRLRRTRRRAHRSPRTAPRRRPARASCPRTPSPPALAVGALGIDVVDRRQRLVRRARRGFDRLARAGQAVEDGGDPDDLVPGVLERLDRLDRRAAGGADVLDDQAAIAGLQRRALDLPLQAVGLGLLADEERLHVGAAGERRAGDRVGAHGQAAHGGGAALARQRRDELGKRGEALGAQDRALGVDVIRRLRAAGQRHLADDQGVLAQRGDESGAGIRGGGHGRAVPYPGMGDRFGDAPFALGVEEELLLVDPRTHLLAPDAPRILAAVEDLKPDLYLALVESVSPITAGPAEAVAAMAATRTRVREAGATIMGSGIHPAGAFGDAPHVSSPRYEQISEELRGLARRTPTCALHVHVGMPDRETALRVYNALREHLPLIQALAANSPFWHGIDSGLASARAQLFRAFPRAEIPRPFASWDEYESTTDAVVRAGDLPDYTYLWWDLRPHPNLGTVEVRAMDAQSSLRDAAALTALVHALALRAAESEPVDPSPREALMESSFRAARDGLDATLWFGEALRPVPEIADTVLGGLEGEGLDEVRRLLTDGNGAIRRRRAFERGGMRELLAELVDDAAQPA